MSVSKNANTHSDRDLLIERLVNAPRERVWDVWVSPEHLDHWWGPNGFRTSTVSWDFKPGGQWRFVMHGPDGRDYKNLITFKRIDPQELIAYDHRDDDEDLAAAGKATAFETTVTFAKQGRKTLVSLHILFPTHEERERIVKEFGAIEGGKQTLGRLAAYAEEKDAQTAAANIVPFTIERTFNAPRQLVWDAHTRAESLEQWWGPKGCKLGVKALEFKPGGLFHYVMRYSTGNEMWGRFFYRDLQEPERMVYLSSFSNEGGGIARAPFGALPFELLNTVTLREHGGKTTLAIHTVPFGANAEEIAFFDNLRDTKSLQQGFTGTLDQLEVYLASVVKS